MALAAATGFVVALATSIQHDHAQFQQKPNSNNNTYYLLNYYEERLW